MNLYLRYHQPAFEHRGEVFSVAVPLMAEDRCYTEVWGTVLGAVIAAGASAAIASQSSPNYPNLASGSRRVAETQAGLLPTLRGLSAAEQEGGAGLRAGYTQSVVSDKEQQAWQHTLDKLQRQLAREQQHPTQTRTDRAGNIIDSTDRRVSMLQKQISDTQELLAVPVGEPIYRNAKGKAVPSSEAMADFSGYGTADIQGQLAGKYADIQEELGRKYGTEFAKTAADLAAQADPEGTAARKAEMGLIQKQIDNPSPINPLSTTLESQIDSQLKAGSGLDSMSQDLLDSAVSRANADRGGSLASGDVAGEMSQGGMGAARRLAAEGKAQGFLQSGSTPEDIKYRREQQNLADLSAFVNGQTPQSQFASLSGAGTGAAPFYPGQQLPSQPTPQSQTAFGAAAYQQELRNQQAQSSPWLAGLSSVISGVGAGVAANQPKG